MFVGLFVYKEIKFSDIPKILTDSAMTMATVLLIMSASTIFGWILTKQQIPQAVAAGFLSISASKYVFLLLVNVLLLIIGMFCEAGAAMVILAPLLAPVAQTSDCRRAGCYTCTSVVTVVCSLIWSVKLLVLNLGVRAQKWEYYENYRY